MLWFYRLLFLPALVVFAPRYLLRMWRRGGYAADFAQRFGGHPRLPAKSPGRLRIWFQAVSVGEMLAIGPILDALHRDGVEVYLTTTTSTGHKLAREKYRDRIVGLGYFPVDWWWFAARAWSRIDPDLAILTEGERWPEFLHQARCRSVPVLCINARLSDRSFARMKTFPPASGLMLSGLTRVLAGSSEDERRFRELGLPAERLSTTGNIKLDVQIPPLSETERTQLLRELGLGAGGRVIVGSSTWPGEEEALLEALRHARAAGARCSLLLVPRHAERRGEIERVLGASRLRFHFRSRGAAVAEVDVAVADTTGELRRLVQLADVVFVGKSLPPHTEGQTPVEAAASRKAILFGPGMRNFRPIAGELLARRAARVVNDSAALAAAITELLGDDRARSELAEAAAQWHRANAGAMARTLAAIREELGRLSRRKT